MELECPIIITNSGIHFFRILILRKVRNQTLAVLKAEFEGCNIVDIGANIGDTTLNLAAAAGGEATVAAFEVGPSLDLLKLNIRQNPQFKINVHEVAVSDKFGTISFGHNGNNGGVPFNTNSSLKQSFKHQSEVKAVKLYQYLQEQYPSEFIDNICFIKIDTEGHDITILKVIRSQQR